MAKSHKKVSAFSVFKAKKAGEYQVPQNDESLPIPSTASSMTSLNSQFEDADKVSLSSTLQSRRSVDLDKMPPGSGRSHHAGRRSGGEKVAALRDIFRGSLRKRRSSEEGKKEKKLHRNSKGRPSFLPDDALDSPVAAPDVKLTSIRTRASSSKVNGLPPRPQSASVADMTKGEKTEDSSTLPSELLNSSMSRKLRSSASDLRKQITSTPYNDNSSLSLFTAKPMKSPKGKSPELPDARKENENLIDPNSSVSTVEFSSPVKQEKTPERRKTPENKGKLSDKKKTPKRKDKTPEIRRQTSERKQSTPKDPSPEHVGKRQRQSSPEKKTSPTLKAVSPSPKKRKVDPPLCAMNESEELPPLVSSTSDIPDVADASPTSVTALEKPSLTMYDSEVEAQNLFKLMIHPVKTDKFFKDLWERKPLIVKRHKTDYNEGWFSTAELDRILREHHLEFGKNLDVTTYENGKRETHNPPGRAYAPVVWDYYNNGCSVRLLNPQSFCPSVWKCLSVLQEYFGCFVGANVYLTPPGSQGFSPHYDDIEAFVIQLEGRKHWKLYNPVSEAETLPRVSSKNLPDTDLGEPLLDAEIGAGDLLYFPRGIVHQARTPADTHSLHITVSACQKNSWGDLMEKMLPQALQLAIEEDVEFRKALPREYLGYMGIVNSDKECEGRTSFLKKIEGLMKKLLTHAPVDSACDQMGQKVIHDSLPPFLTEADKSCSIHGMGEKWNEQEGRVCGRIELEPDTCIKIIRKGVIRLVMEEDLVRVYHSLENSRVFHEKEEQFIDVSSEAAPAIEHLIHHYPKYVPIDSLPLDSIMDKIDIATQLYEKGLLLTYEPLVPLTDDSSGVGD